MLTQPLSSTAELMREQVMSAVSVSCPNLDKQELQQSLAGIFAQYDIKPAPLPNGHPDLAAKDQTLLGREEARRSQRKYIKGIST